MKTNAKIRRTVSTALLCAGLASTGGAWAEDCNIRGGEMEAAGPDGSQTEGLSNVADVKPISRLDPEFYSYLHDPELHKSDGLGQNFGDFSGATNRH
jgi:hypothetical protein